MEPALFEPFAVEWVRHAVMYRFLQTIQLKRFNLWARERFKLGMEVG